MKNFGLVCPPMTGHMHTMLALGRELVRRGDRATVISHPDAQARAERAGLEFQPIGAVDFPPGTLAEFLSGLAGTSGRAALDRMMDMGVRAAAAYVRDLPGVIRERRLDALLIDQMSLPAGAAADAASIPFLCICSALPADMDLRVPPCGLHWAYRPGWTSRIRNSFGYAWLGWQTWRSGVEIMKLVKPLGVRRTWRISDWESRLATIAQIPAEFDFPVPRRDTFHYVGPFIDPALRPPAEFPFERLDGRPLIYASLGTLLHGHADFFRRIAQACDGRDAQLVVALGGGDPSPLKDLPGSPIVVGYAPQLELLKRASLTISHAGLNTVMESLACGVPMVSIPTGGDTPGIAARLEWHGAGERILPGRLTAERLRTAIDRVLTEPSYREQARRMQRAIESTDGPRRAADIIEAALVAA